jgi:putative aldouronate transport system substrate-binding protein
MSSLFGFGVVLALLALIPGCSKGKQEAGKGLKDLDTSKPVEVIMYYTGDEPARQKELWDNFNTLSKAKLNTTLRINMLPQGEYRTKYPLIFASGEVFDLSYAATWLNFAQLAKRGSFMALEELAPNSAPRTYARQTPTAISQATVDGHLYALPSLYPTYSAYGPVYRADLLKGTDWDGKMETFADMERYLALVKANRPDIEPFQVYSGGSEADDLYIYNNGIFPLKGSTGDFLFIDPAQPNPRIFTYYEWDKTKDFLAMMDRWNKAGYFPKSGLADVDGGFKMRDGKAALYIHNIDTWEGYYRLRPDWDVRYSNFVTDISNMAFTQDACVVANTSRNPERALALWDLILSDEEVYRAFYYGIEGLTYKIHDVDGQKYVEPTLQAGVFDFTRMWAARTKEFFLPTLGAPPDLNTIKRGFDARIKDGVGAQKFRSFVLDTSSVETEYANCINAHQQYWWPLELAYTDPAAGLVEYEKQMKAAGIDKVREALQTQLDAYLTALK